MTTDRELAQRLRCIEGKLKTAEWAAILQSAIRLEQIADADASLPRRALGVFKGAPALFAQPDGDYVKYADAVTALSTLQEQLRASYEALKSISNKADLAASMCNNDGRAKGFVYLKSIADAAILAESPKEPKV